MSDRYMPFINDCLSREILTGTGTPLRIYSQSASFANLFNCHLCRISDIPLNALIVHDDKDYHEEKIRSFAEENLEAPYDFNMTQCARESSGSYLEYLADSMRNRCVIGMDAIVEISDNNCFMCRVCPREVINPENLEGHVKSHDHWKCYLMRTFPSVMEQLQGVNDKNIFEKIAINYESRFGRKFNSNSVTFDSYEHNIDYHRNEAISRIDNIMEGFGEILLEGIEIPQEEILVEALANRISIQPDENVRNAQFAALCAEIYAYKNNFKSDIIKGRIDELYDSINSVTTKEVERSDIRMLSEVFGYTQSNHQLRKLGSKISDFLEVHA